MASKIHGAEYPIQKIFCDDFVFSIPRYQRPYAWGTEQAEALLDDLLGFLGETDEPISQLSPYFLGSIVLIKPEGKADAEVVDGQQRLTTLTILLAALRKSLPAEYNPEKLTQFLYEEGNEFTGTQNRYRLTLRERDADFFHTFVLDEGGLDQLAQLDDSTLSDSQTNIRNNALQFEERLQEISASQRFRLAQFVVTGCLLVVVSTPDFDAAYRIFSVLNDRGLDLSPTDILKSEIIGQLSEAQQDSYNSKWEDQEENLGRDAFRDLFSHIRMIYRKAKSQDSILKEVREHVKPVDDPAYFIDQVLCPKAQAYSDIQDCSFQSNHHAAAINTYFSHLKKIDNVDWLPPAIHYLSLHRNQPVQLLAFFKALDRLASGLMIQRTSINKRIKRYGQILADIEVDKDLFLPESPLSLTPDDCEAIIQRLDGPLYREQKIRRYVLLRLDAALAETIAIYDYPKVTVEHVLPQNPAPNSQWLSSFPEEEIREHCVHRLGNLVLLPRNKNSSAANYDFKTKKEKYFTSQHGVSSFVMTTQVLAESEWTPAVIDRRQQVLLSKLKEIWQLELPVPELAA